MLKNIVALLFSTGSKLAMNAVLLIVLAKYLGVEGYGVFVTSIALTSISVIVLDFGFSTYIVKHVAESKRLVNPIIKKALSLKLYLFLVYIALTQILCFAMIETDYLLQYNLVVLMTLINSFIEFNYVAFRAISKFYIEAKLSVVSTLIHFILIVSIAISTENLTFVILSYVIAKVITLLLSFGAYRREFFTIPFPKRTDLEYSKVKELFIRVKNYGFDSAIINIRANIDTVLVKALLGYEVVGIYQAGVNIVKAIERLGPILANVYLPKLAKLGQDFKGYFLQLLLCMIVAPILLSCVIVNLDFSMVLDENYILLNDLMPWFMLYMTLRYICMALGVFITAIGLQSLRVKYGIINLFFATVSFIILIPIYGVYGAVYSMNITAGLLLICFYSVVKNNRKYLR